MYDALKIKSLLDLSHTIAAPLFEKYEYPWQVLPEIQGFIRELISALDDDIYEKRENGVCIARSAKVSPTAYIGPDTIICEGAEIRHCAFIRGSAVVGAGATVGNSTELKNAVLFDGAQAPHFNYVGDSVYGYKAHTGAGVITSNLKSDKSLVTVNFQGEKIVTGIKKFGAILGDFTEAGCNTVLNPGTVTGRHCNIYPLSMVRGYVPENSIYKNRNEIVGKEG